MKFLQNCLYIFRFNYPRSPEGEGGILFYLCPSFRPSKIFFSATIDDTNLIFGHKFHIVGSVFGPIRFLLPVCRLLIFIHIEHICSFFVTFFSATIDGRNLIFRCKLHIGTPFCGKCFLTRQIPTSCLPT